MSRYLGPLGLLSLTEELDYVNVKEDIIDKVKMSDMSAQMSSLALREVQALLDAAQAKAKHALVANWDALGSLVSALLSEQVLSAAEVSEILAQNGGLEMFPSSGLGDDEVSERYGWVEGGAIRLPGPAPRPLFGQEALPLRTIKLPLA